MLLDKLESPHSSCLAGSHPGLWTAVEEVDVNREGSLYSCGHTTLGNGVRHLHGMDGEESEASSGWNPASTTA